MTNLLFRDDAYLRTCTATVESATVEGITLNQTIFYPTGGGQPGDTGWLKWDGGTCRIADTRKGEGPDSVLHIPEAGAALPPVGTTVIAELDWDRRYAHMKMHTALHLLCALVPGSVTGGQVGADKSRLDFDIPGAAVDKDDLTLRLNTLIEANHDVTADWITDEQMTAQPDLVRTLSVKPPMGQGRVRLIQVANTDRQPCGGTHVKNIGEIGRLTVTKIENKGKQNRRISIAFEDAAVSAVA